jgi:hypothetical protein
MVRQLVAEERFEVVGLGADELQPDEVSVIEVGPPDVTDARAQGCEVLMRLDRDVEEHVALQRHNGLDQRA